MLNEMWKPQFVRSQPSLCAAVSREVDLKEMDKKE